MKHLIFYCAFLIAVAWSVPAGTQTQVTVTHSAVNVTTSSTEVLATTPIRRNLLILINDSDTVIYCNVAGGAAALNAGLRLGASGGAALFDVSVPRAKINCIHGGTGNKVMLVGEG